MKHTIRPQRLRFARVTQFYVIITSLVPINQRKLVVCKSMAIFGTWPDHWGERKEILNHFALNSCEHIYKHELLGIPTFSDVLPGDFHMLRSVHIGEKTKTESFSVWWICETIYCEGWLCSVEHLTWSIVCWNKL